VNFFERFLLGKNLKGRKFLWALPIFKLRENYTGIREFYKLRISSKIRRFLHTSGFFCLLIVILILQRQNSLRMLSLRGKHEGFLEEQITRVKVN
jgi:hypothetical protein